MSNFEIKRELASSGFATVEHFNLYCDGIFVSGHWSHQDAEAAIPTFVSKAEERRYVISKKKLPRVHRTSS
jgi:hypothetical protein